MAVRSVLGLSCVSLTVVAMLAGCTSAPVNPDPDGDGLSTVQETTGVLAADRHRYTSDPHRADTDNDGIRDDQEIGKPIQPSSGPSASPVEPTYPVRSDPRKDDTDADGLDDAGEYDWGTRPFVADSDRDGLPDGVEVQVLSTDPSNSDTDRDGLTDAVEVAQRLDGRDPLRAEPKPVSLMSNVGDFLLGFIAGRFAERDSLAWLAGHLAPVLAGLLPGWGWLVGALANLRDAIASALGNDWRGAGENLIQMVPVAGKLTELAARITKFVERNLHKLVDVLTYLASVVGLGVDAKVAMVKAAVGAHWEKLIDAGATGKALVALAKGRTNLVDLANTVGNRKVAGRPVMAFNAVSGAQKLLQSQLSADAKNEEYHVLLATPDIGTGSRLADVFVDGEIHQALFGYVTLNSHVREQIAKDAFLLRQGGMVTVVRWHFYASETSIGADPQVYQLLAQQGIDYQIHLPV